MIRRGQVWRVDLGTPRGSSPGHHRPVVVVQADSFNQSTINTVVVAVITSNLRLAEMPGNVLLNSMAAGLDRDSVVNVTQLFTLDRNDLLELLGTLPQIKIEQMAAGLRLVLDLE